MSKIFESLCDSGVIDNNDFGGNTQNHSKLETFQLHFQSFFPKPNPLLWGQIMNQRYVFLIGPASYTLQYNRTNLIQKFDYIARCNHSIPVMPNNYNAIGNRTDIYYNNLYPDNNKNILNPHLLQSNKVKIVVCSYPYIQPFGKDIERYIRRKEGGNTPFRVMPTPLYNQIQKTVKTRPNTGILALMDLIYSPTDTVYLSGFTFFSTPTTYSNRKGVDQTLHQQEPQKELVRHQACFNPRLILDSPIRESLWKKEYEWFNVQWKLLKEGFTYLQLTNLWKDKVNELKSSLQETVWTYNQEGISRLYRFQDDKWNLLFEIEPFDFLDSFNPFIRIMTFKKLTKIPKWFINWWVIQHTWMNDVIIPCLKTNIDAYLTVPWIYTNDKEISDDIFKNVMKFPKQDFMMANKYSFLDILYGTQQAVWVNNIDELKIILRRHEFFS